MTMYCFYGDDHVIAIQNVNSWNKAFRYFKAHLDDTFGVVTIEKTPIRIIGETYAVPMYCIERIFNRIDAWNRT